MASPISSTRPTDPPKASAFTLVELMVAMALGVFVLAGVLSTFLMICRSGANVANYSDLESQTRTALETFSREARMANSVGSGYSSTRVTLGIPDSSSSSSSVAYSVTYAFDLTNRTFTRTGPPLNDPTGASTTTVLVSGVEQISGVNPFNYYRYVTSGGYTDGFTSNTASSATEIKQIEINFIAQRTSVTVASATNKVLSARFILRNK